MVKSIGKWPCVANAIIDAGGSFSGRVTRKAPFFSRSETKGGGRRVNVHGDPGVLFCGDMVKESGIESFPQGDAGVGVQNDFSFVVGEDWKASKEGESWRDQEDGEVS